MRRSGSPTYHPSPTHARAKHVLSLRSAPARGSQRLFATSRLSALGGGESVFVGHNVILTVKTIASGDGINRRLVAEYLALKSGSVLTVSYWAANCRRFRRLGNLHVIE